MEKLNMKYGREVISVPIPEKNLLGVINANPFDLGKSEEEIILDALNNPIASAKLCKLVHSGETICIVISDVTRLWQRMNVYIKYIVEELKKAEIKDEDITFLCAAGSHRAQTEEEIKKLLGDELAGKYKFVNHDCLDKNSLTYMGTTTYNNPIYLNKTAVEIDHVILTGGIVYHFLVGWGGGRKSVLPGISAYETIMNNHELSLSKDLGKGTLPSIKSGNIKDNPVHNDMLQAVNFLKPTFMFNSIIGSNGKICAAVAGNYIKAHEEGCRIVDKKDGVYINELADMVIASAAGYPKDINFYQSIKTVMNAVEALKPGGTMILMSECSEGLGGDQDVKDMLLNYTNTLDREKALREKYTIAKFVGYYTCNIADKYNFILVSNLDKELLKNTNIKVVKTIEEALDIVYKEKGENLTTYAMPYAANTFPILKNKN
ncbi:nickel-dependent lactate racemase [Clostridium ganghwense]|uniref:Nickel-dependent lactate racemase n=1 Tax=Clostridium ganghwense TaxID=312089 RepID=A0ABT4CJF6_9CLOT|nr:nickel-dependent lactate racemase [Clostridium ganghwense]MCY6369177.1 nickel-dependent lactate racemase [Clostridium ganghwense]